MSALGRVVRSGVGRRRVQTVVIGLVVMIAVTAAVLGGSLLVASNAPFDRAFAQQHGAHLTAQFDATKTTAAQLVGVRAAPPGSPRRPARSRPPSITPVDDRDRPMPPMTVVGRAEPAGGRRRGHADRGAVGDRPGRDRGLSTTAGSRPRAAERSATVLTAAGPARQPDPDRRRPGPVGQRDRRRLGGPGADRGVDRAGRGRRLPDALPLRRGRHRRAGRRRPRRGGGERLPAGALTGRGPGSPPRTGQRRRTPSCSCRS